MRKYPGSPSRWSAATVGLALLVAVPYPVEAAEPAESGYLEALVDLAAGHREAALDALVRYETAAAPETTSEQIESLGKVELRMARRLASRSAECLVPVARLHERAYLSHLEARRLQLAVHSRQLTVALVDLYRVGSVHPQADRIAAELLTSLGGHLQEASMASLAMGLYEQAVELAPDDPTPLLGLANVFERQGDYDRALPHLERALRVAPGHREAMLRRGILLLRSERVAEGERQLGELLAGERDDWILSLAYQELARSRSRSRDFQGALDLLLEARRRLPDDPSLPVQIAYLADRTESAGSVESLAAALRAAAESRSPSPRSVYGRVAGDSLETLRQALEEHSRQRLVYLEQRTRKLAGPDGAP